MSNNTQDVKQLRQARLYALLPFLAGLIFILAFIAAFTFQNGAFLFFFWLLPISATFGIVQSRKGIHLVRKTRIGSTLFTISISLSVMYIVLTALVLMFIGIVADCEASSNGTGCQL